MGRKYFLELHDGAAHCTVFFGTTELAHGTDIWDRIDLAALPVHVRERDILDALYEGVLAFMERRVTTEA